MTTLPPHNENAERALLGAILIDPAAYHTAAEYLTAQDFYIHRHRWIWEAFAGLADDGQVIDVLTVSHALERNGKLTETGGLAYLTQLVGSTPSSLHAETYAREIQECAHRRRILDAANRAAKMAYENIPPTRAAGQVVADMLEIAEGGENGPVPLGTASGEYIRRLMDIADRRAAGDPSPMGIPTGYPDLDRILGGMAAGDLVLIAGRPGMGKTALLINIAANLAQGGKRGVFFSLEMSREQISQRLIARETGIDGMRLRVGNLTPDEITYITETHTALEGWPLMIDDTAQMTTVQMRARAMRLARRGLDYIMVDYVQLIAPSRRYDNRNGEVSAISRSLKLLARDLGVPVLAAAQLSRSVEQRADKRPVLSDLRDSGALEQDADIVLFPFRPSYYDADRPGVCEVIIAKHRHGGTGSVELYFDAKTTKFAPLARREVMF